MKEKFPGKLEFEMYKIEKYRKTSIYVRGFYIIKEINSKFSHKIDV